MHCRKLSAKPTESSIALRHCTFFALRHLAAIHPLVARCSATSLPLPCTNHNKPTNLVQEAHKLPQAHPEASHPEASHPEVLHTLVARLLPLAMPLKVVIIELLLLLFIHER
jgi:hypothetical protein